MTLVVLCLAAVAGVGFASSLVIGAFLGLVRQPIVRLAPSAEARLLLFLAVLPFLLAMVVMTGALAPAFGWIADHCEVAIIGHAHPHLCVDHHVVAWPGVPLVAIGLLLAARLAVTVGSIATGAVRVRRAGRELDGLAGGARFDEARILPLDEPQAFLLGVIKPRLYVTRGLVDGEHAVAVLAHERAHRRRRDPLRRLIARFGLAFHLPGIAAALERRLSRAHEMAADAEAAREVDSPGRVATALLEVVRARLRPALGFGGQSQDELELRVRRLLDDRSARDWLKPPVLATVLFAAQIGVLAAADAVHHGMEHALGMLGG